MVQYYHNYKKLEIKLGRHQLVYVHQKNECMDNCENEGKKITRSCKVLDLFLSLVYSIYRFLKNILD